MSIGRPLLLCTALLAVTAGFLPWRPADAARHQRTPSYTAEGAAGCLHCHSGALMRAVQSGPHHALQGPGVPRADQYCESCHGPGSIHVSRAHGGRGFPPLTAFGRGAARAPRAEQIAACQSCHGDPDRVAQVIAFDGSPHDRGSINCSTCHTIHGAAWALAERATQAALCARCHRRQASGHPRPGSNPAAGGPRCSDCHQLHRRPVAG